MSIAWVAWTVIAMVGSGWLVSARGADELFGTEVVRHIRLEISTEGMESLRRDARIYVRGSVSEGSALIRDVGIHLKGSTGSFRPLDDKPGFTLSFGKFVAGQTFHGLRKIHLNNSVEDASYLNESLGEELFRRAGVPAARTAHALVELNGRRLGLYVLKEGFTEDFLGLHFRETRGNLYDTGPGFDVNEALEKDGGAGPDDRSDLQALAAAALEPDLTQRWARLEKALDVDRFASFMAMEVLAAHRDGYCLARNNFRLYHDPAANRFVFLPHGMDQLFGPATLPLYPQMAGLVARAVMETPEGRSKHRKQMTFLFTNVFQVHTLTQRVDQLLERLRPALSRAEAREVVREAAHVKSRIIARAASVAQQLSEPERTLLRFDNGMAQLGAWRPVDVPKGATPELSPDGVAALGLHAGESRSASWRTRVWLPPGRYRFEAMARTKAVQPLSFGKNHGAGLRLSGAKSQPAPRASGDSPWTKLALEFEVDSAMAEIELICELRARSGSAWFDVATLRVVDLR